MSSPHAPPLEILHPSSDFALDLALKPPWVLQVGIKTFSPWFILPEPIYTSTRVVQFVRAPLHLVFRAKIQD